MKSSDRIIENGFLANGPLYSLLALYMPVTIFASLILIIESYFSFSLDSVILIASCLLSGILASLYRDLMKDVKASQTAANIRGGIIIIAFFYAFSSLLRFSVPISGRFFPYFTNILSVLGAIYAWVYVISLKTIFSARKRFEIYSQMYQGKELQQVLYEDSSLLQYTDESINKEKNKYLTQLVIIGVLTVLCQIMGIALPLNLYILLIIMFIGGVSIFSFFEIIKWEHYYSAEGISLSAQERNKRIMAAAVISLICLAAALILASGKSIIPFSIITGFFSWLFSLFRSEREYIPREDPDFQMGLDIPPAFMPFGESAEPEEPSRVFEIIQEILKYGLIILVIALFIRFMISPLLNRGDILKNLTFRQKIVLIFKEMFKGIFTGIASFFSFLKHGRTMSKLRNYSSEEIMRTAEDIFSAYSTAKKSDMKHSVTLFARLIVWGSDVRKLKWQPSHAPGEFCALLAGAVPRENDHYLLRLNENIIRCGEIFEKALYSFEVLSSEERKEFKKLVEEITSSAE